MEEKTAVAKRFKVSFIIVETSPEEFENAEDMKKFLEVQEGVSDVQVEELGA